MPDLLEEAKRLSEGLSAPGPWRVHRDEHGGLYVRAARAWTVDDAFEDESWPVDGVATLVDQDSAEAEAHADFIARARTLIPELVERLEQQRDAIEGFLLNEYPEGVPPNSHASHLQSCLAARKPEHDHRPHEDFLTQEELQS